MQWEQSHVISLQGIHVNQATMAVFRKIRSDAEMVFDVNVANGLEEPFPARKQYERRRASLDGERGLRRQALEEDQQRILNTILWTP